MSWSRLLRRRLPAKAAPDDLCFRCLELTTGLWRSSSSLQGGPSPSKMGARLSTLLRFAQAVLSQLVELSQFAGSERRRDSLAGVVMPDGGREGSGGGP